MSGARQREVAAFFVPSRQLFVPPSRWCSPAVCRPPNRRLWRKRQRLAVAASVRYVWWRGPECLYVLNGVVGRAATVPVQGRLCCGGAACGVGAGGRCACTVVLGCMPVTGVCVSACPSPCLPACLHQTSACSLYSTCQCLPCPVTTGMEVVGQVVGGG